MKMSSDTSLPLPNNWGNQIEAIRAHRAPRRAPPGVAIPLACDGRPRQSPGRSRPRRRRRSDRRAPLRPRSRAARDRRAPDRSPHRGSTSQDTAVAMSEAMIAGSTRRSERAAQHFEGEERAAEREPRKRPPSRPRHYRRPTAVVPHRTDARSRKALAATAPARLGAPSRPS
jgi:hypothetical protein